MTVLIPKVACRGNAPMGHQGTLQNATRRDEESTRPALLRRLHGGGGGGGGDRDGKVLGNARVSHLCTLLQQAFERRWLARIDLLFSTSVNTSDPGRVSSMVLTRSLYASQGVMQLVMDLDGGVSGNRRQRAWFSLSTLFTEICSSKVLHHGKVND